MNLYIVASVIVQYYPSVYDVTNRTIDHDLVTELKLINVNF